MDDDNIIKLVSATEVPKDDGPEFFDHQRETHFYTKTFLSYDEADKYIEDIIATFDLEEFYIVGKEVKHINDVTYRAGLIIYRRQGELGL